MSAGSSPASWTARLMASAFIDTALRPAKRPNAVSPSPAIAYWSRNAMCCWAAPLPVRPHGGGADDRYEASGGWPTLGKRSRKAPRVMR